MCRKRYVFKPSDCFTEQFQGYKVNGTKWLWYEIAKNVFDGVTHTTLIPLHLLRKYCTYICIEIITQPYYIFSSFSNTIYTNFDHAVT